MHPGVIHFPAAFIPPLGHVCGKTTINMTENADHKCMVDVKFNNKVADG